MIIIRLSVPICGVDPDRLCLAGSGFFTVYEMLGFVSTFDHWVPNSICFRLTSLTQRLYDISLVRPTALPRFKSWLGLKHFEHHQAYLYLYFLTQSCPMSTT